VTGTVNNATNKAYNAEFVLGGFAQPAVPRSWVVDARYNF
jgi:iron complex outermembrane receptor protein